MYVSKALYNDLKAARQSQSADRKPYTVTHLTSKGTPSKIAADTVRFATIEEAQAYMERVISLNPTRTIRFATNF